MQTYPSDTRVALFRINCALAQLQFAEKNPGVLNWDQGRIRLAILEGAVPLGLLSEETHVCFEDIGARELAERILYQTQMRFPDLFSIAELAQSATFRLLYLGSSIEDEDVSAVMALELTAKLAADKLGVPDGEFMAWYKSQFAEDVNPQTVMGNLESLVAQTGLVTKNVFLSYRSDDTRQLIGRLADRLKAAGFDPFYDKENLRVGELWKEELHDRISQSDVVLAVIGRSWLSDRLLEQDDPVKMEIALSFDLKKPVITLLVDRAVMPMDRDLPPELKRLRDTHAAQLDIGVDFDQQMDRVLAALTQLLKRE